MPADSDKDGTPDYQDSDSDDDGLSDGEELTLGTNPTDSDTDDGVMMRWRSQRELIHLLQKAT